MLATQTRRRFLAALSSAGATGFLGGSNSDAQEAPPETTSVTLAVSRGLCLAPLFTAEDFLRVEGFTDVRFVMSDAGLDQSRVIATGEVDFTLNFSSILLIPLDAGAKITIIAGIHVGCFEL